MNQSVSCHRAWCPHIFFLTFFRFSCLPFFFSSAFPSPRRCNHPPPLYTAITISAATKSDSLSICHFLANIFFRTSSSRLPCTYQHISELEVFCVAAEAEDREGWLLGWISGKIHRWQKLSRTDETFVKCFSELCVSTLCQFLKWFVSVIQPWFKLEGSLRADPYLHWQWVNYEARRRK